MASKSCPQSDSRKKGSIMNDLQRQALTALAERYNVEINDDNFRPTFDLPAGYVAGWVGPIYVGVSPEGRISS